MTAAMLIRRNPRVLLAMDLACLSVAASPESADLVQVAAGVRERQTVFDLGRSVRVSGVRCLSGSSTGPLVTRHPGHCLNGALGKPGTAWSTHSHAAMR